MEFQAIQFHEHCPAVVCMSWLDLTNQAMGPHTRQLVETSIFLANRVQVSHGGDYIQTGFRHKNFHNESATKLFSVTNTMLYFLCGLVPTTVTFLTLFSVNMVCSMSKYFHRYPEQHDY
jgi:hypothetical protein